MLDKARNIRMLILDVDGVMTDGGILYTNDREELKYFHVKDGLGIRMLIQEGIKVLIISGRSSKAVEYRAEDLGIEEVHQGVRDKVAVFEEVLRRHKITANEVGYMGDDLVDIPLLSRVGFAVSVADAVKEVKERVDYITSLPGGKGAVREICDLILKAKGRWKKCIQ